MSSAATTPDDEDNSMEDDSGELSYLSLQMCISSHLTNLLRSIRLDFEDDEKGTLFVDDSVVLRTVELILASFPPSMCYSRC